MTSALEHRTCSCYLNGENPWATDYLPRTAAKWVAYTSWLSAFGLPAFKARYALYLRPWNSYTDVRWEDGAGVAGRFSKRWSSLFNWKSHLYFSQSLSHTHSSQSSSEWHVSAQCGHHQIQVHVLSYCTGIIKDTSKRNINKNQYNTLQT
jgi:hypothetical protein